MLLLPLPGLLLLALAVWALVRSRNEAIRAVIRSVVETAPQGTLLVQEGRIVMASERACRMLGQGREALTGRPLADLALAEDAAFLLGGGQGTREIALTRADGATAWVEAGGAPVPWRGTGAAAGPPRPW